ncbi:unannotated protein [freshwater metagenome]|uniref:Unannotated protein n=1 Tax=freshwater metagenome TaxID=449393 RepID=A0A6J7IY33_9ZZZZ
MPISLVRARLGPRLGDRGHEVVEGHRQHRSPGHREHADVVDLRRREPGVGLLLVPIMKEASVSKHLEDRPVQRMASRERNGRDEHIPAVRAQIRVQFRNNGRFHPHERGRHVHCRRERPNEVVLPRDLLLWRPRLHICPQTLRHELSQIRRQPRIRQPQVHQTREILKRLRETDTRLLPRHTRRARTDISRRPRPVAL